MRALFSPWCVLFAGLGVLPLSAAQAEPNDAMPNTLPDDKDAPLPESSEQMPSTLTDDPSALHADVEAEGPPLRFEAELVGALAVGIGSGTGPTSYGFGITYGVAWGAIPVMFGVDFMSVNSSDQVSAISLELPADQSSTVANKFGRDRTMYFDLWLRVQPARWVVRPYVEGFLGTKLVQTRYSLTAQPTAAAGDAGATPTSDVMNDHSWASSFGWGAGVDFWGLFKAAGAISLTLGVRQLSGAKASFERELLVDGHAAVARYAVPTTITIFMAGIMGQFDMSAEPDPYADTAR